jgi:hypothetical protein
MHDGESNDKPVSRATARMFIMGSPGGARAIAVHTVNSAQQIGGGKHTDRPNIMPQATYRKDCLLNVS